MYETHVERTERRRQSIAERFLDKLKEYTRTLGPGLVTGASDDDPSCIGTLSQTGAAFGYSQLWMAPLTYPLMGSVQEMCARIGLYTGHGLAANLRQYYPKPILYICVSLIAVANIIQIGADLGAMAAAAHLLVGFPIVIWLIAIPLLSIGLQIFTDYKHYNHVLRILTLTLLAYVAVVFLVPQNWGEVFKGTFIPTFRLERDYIMNIVAVFGSAISPYLFFWQMSQEVERKIDEGNTREKTVKGVVTRVAAKGVSHHGVFRMRIDVLSGMLVAGLVGWSVIVTTASTLNQHGTLKVESAAQVAEALRPLAGNFSYLLFAMGIIGVGLLALPILAGSVAYAVAETFDLRAGVSLRLLQAPGFYGVIVFATVVGAAINLIGINPMQALYYAAVINGVTAPVLLTMVMLIGSNRNIMHDRTNSWISNVLGWFTALVMGVSAIALFITLVSSGR